MSRYDIPGDAQRIYDTVAAGGAVIMPSDIGYGAVGPSTSAWCQPAASNGFQTWLSDGCGAITWRSTDSGTSPTTATVAACTRSATSGPTNVAPRSVSRSASITSFPSASNPSRRIELGELSGVKRAARRHGESRRARCGFGVTDLDHLRISEDDLRQAAAIPCGGFRAIRHCTPCAAGHDVCHDAGVVLGHMR